MLSRTAPFRLLERSGLWAILVLALMVPFCLGWFSMADTAALDGKPCEGGSTQVAAALASEGSAALLASLERSWRSDSCGAVALAAPMKTPTRASGPMLVAPQPGDRVYRDVADRMLPPDVRLLSEVLRL